MAKVERGETVWKVGWRGVNEGRSLACNAKIRSPCPSMLVSVAPVWCPSGLSRQSLYARLYPIKPHSKAFRLSAPRHDASRLSPARTSENLSYPSLDNSGFRRTTHLTEVRLGAMLIDDAPGRFESVGALDWGV